jgi:subtilase family serine protease
VFEKPAWQHGFNVPDDGFRDIPDIAMGASGDDPGFWVAGQTDKDSSPNFVATGGTSIASPMWGAISRLIAQSQGVTRLGNINQRLYELGNLQSATSGLHDITGGNNDNNGIVGFDAGPGFDLATGWGSPNIALLVAAFPGAALTNQTLSVTVAKGATATAGSFSIANTTPEPLLLNGITVSVTSPNLFSSVQVKATAGGSSVSQNAEPPLAQTVVTFPAPLEIPIGGSAQISVSVTAAGGHGSSMAGTLLDFGGNTPGPWTGGLIAILLLTGTIAAFGRRRRYAIAGFATFAVMAIAISSCGGGGSSGGGTTTSKSTLSMAQGSANVSDGQGGIVEVGGLPVTLSNVKVK